MNLRDAEGPAEVAAGISFSGLPVGMGAPGVLSECHVSQLGLVEFRKAWDLQTELGQLRAEDQIPDTLLLLQHPHVYTLGRRGDPSNILLSQSELEEKGVEVVEIDRGGDVTYHGPGQLVGYPILRVEDRRDLLSYIRRLEEVIIRTLSDYGITSGRIEGLSGVWIGNEKIAAIGVKMGRVTSHGFALNVNTDLTYFAHIIPCGIRDKGVTSMKEQLRQVLDLDEVATRLTRHFGEVFARTIAFKNTLITT